MTSYLRQKCWHCFETLYTLVPIFASFHKVDLDLQKYRPLQMLLTYDLIDISLQRTINDMVSKINFISSVKVPIFNVSKGSGTTPLPINL